MVLHTDEVFQQNVGHRSITTVALDHVHLVGGPGVDVAVGDVGNVDSSRQRAHGTATTPIAVDALDQNVLGRTLSDN